MKNYVHGLKGLQKLLGVSRSTSIKIKNSGQIPYLKVGKKLMFDPDAVVKALTVKPEGGVKDGN